MRWLIGLLVLVPGISMAATLRVPEDYPTILAAVDAAVSGDSVSVGPGTWTDTATRVVVINVPTVVTACAFVPGGVTIFGRDGRDATIIDLQGAPAGYTVPFLCVNVSEASALSGLTITGVQSVSPAVSCVNAPTFTLSECRVADNVGNAAFGGQCNLVILDSEVSNNGPGASQAVIDVNDAELEMRRCRITGNSARSVSVFGSTPNRVTITDCEIADNIASLGAGGVSLGNAFGEVSNNVFARNVALTGNGGGLNLSTTPSGGVMLVQSNVFIENQAVGGGGLRMGGVTADVVNNTFYGCTSTAGGDAITLNGGTVGFSSNIIAACPTIALGRINGTFTSASGCNVLWNNTTDALNWPLALTDFNADPLFCDPSNGDFTVSSASPCAAGNTPGCGQIGAWGPSCGPVSVEDASWGAIKAGYRD